MTEHQTTGTVAPIRAVDSTDGEDIVRASAEFEAMDDPADLVRQAILLTARAPHHRADLWHAVARHAVALDQTLISTLASQAPDAVSDLLSREGADSRFNSQRLIWALRWGWAHPEPGIHAACDRFVIDLAQDGAKLLDDEARLELRAAVQRQGLHPRHRRKALAALLVSAATDPVDLVAAGAGLANDDRAWESIVVHPLATTELWAAILGRTPPPAAAVAAIARNPAAWTEPEVATALGRYPSQGMARILMDILRDDRTLGLHLLTACAPWAPEARDSAVVALGDELLKGPPLPEDLLLSLLKSESHQVRLTVLCCPTCSAAPAVPAVMPPRPEPSSASRRL